MAIVTLPLPIQLLNGQIADGGQVMSDLNAIASNVNSNAAKNGVNSDITELTALTALNAGLTLTDATLSNCDFNTGTIVGSAIDSTTTVPTAVTGTSDTTLANTAFVTATAFSGVLPAQPGTTRPYGLFTRSSLPFWSGTHSEYLLRTTNTILGASDSGSIIYSNSSFTQTFDTLSTLNEGWCVRIAVGPSGAVTIPLSDGVSNYIMMPYEVRDFYTDGSLLYSFVVHPFAKVFTSSGTFTKPPGYKFFGGLAWSAGASGERNNNVAVASMGGAAGGCFPFTVNASDVGVTESVILGAGGAAVLGVAACNAGGNTSFGSFFTVFGGTSLGTGGAIGVTVAFTAATPSGGFASVSAATGGGSCVYGGGSPSNDASAASGSSIYGGGGGGGVNGAGVLRAAGSSKFGGVGGAASIAGNGTDGTAPGGGGGGTQTGTASGAGAIGQLRIWGIA